MEPRRPTIVAGVCDPCVGRRYRNGTHHGPHDDPKSDPHTRVLTMPRIGLTDPRRVISARGRRAIELVAVSLFGSLISRRGSALLWSGADAPGVETESRKPARPGELQETLRGVCAHSPMITI